MRRSLRIAGWIVAGSSAAALVIFLVNTSALAPAPSERPLLIAHRGLGQTFSREGLTGETCTAERIFPPEHPYLENTIASFAADGAVWTNRIDLIGPAIVAR